MNCPICNEEMSERVFIKPLTLNGITKMNTRTVLACKNRHTCKPGEVFKHPLLSATGRIYEKI